MNMTFLLRFVCTALLMSIASRADAAEMLPDGVVAHGDNDIRSAWLSTPTERYAHGALGDEIEAGAIDVELKDGTRLSLALPMDAVFEDRYPRLADLDGDGRDEMVVVKSTQSQGAALVIVGVRGGALKILAEAEPIGRPYRWLNPVGVGDFDGDGQIELAYVKTPHIGGVLRIVKWQDGKLAQAYSARGFSNHALGTRELNLSAVIDANADGIPDLAVPNTNRKALRIVTFKGGAFQELSRIKLEAPLARLFTQSSGSAPTHLSAQLTNGARVDLIP